MSEKVVIIGGVAAGTKTAAKLRRECNDCKIDLYTQEDVISYSACGIPYFLEGIIPKIEDLIVREPKAFEKEGISIHLNSKCTKILPKEKKIIINDEKEIVFDKLVIATGSSPIVPDIKNIFLKNIFTIKTLEDAKKVKEVMRNANLATIIGGGYIGIEFLEAFVKNEIKTTVIEKSNRILNIFDEDISKEIESYIKNYDTTRIEILTNETVIAFEGNNEVEYVLTNTGKRIRSDFVILAIGVKPNSQLAINAGLKAGIKNTIWTDERMKTSDNNIYAAGDCVQKKHIVTNLPCWIPLGSTSNKEGRVCAISIAGGDEIFEGVLGSAVTRFFDYTIAFTGINEQEAKELGYEVETAIISEDDRAGYMPQAKPIKIKLMADRKTHKILGAQGIGCGQVHKRINTISSALISKMRVEELSNLDLAYAPPYSPTIDPVLTVAKMISDRLNH